MGRGDKRTKKGKIWRGSFGKIRPRKIKKAAQKPEKGEKKEEIKKEVKEETKEKAPSGE